jgi:hypothetical protein
MSENAAVRHVAGWHQTVIPKQLGHVSYPGMNGPEQTWPEVKK